MRTLRLLAAVFMVALLPAVALAAPPVPMGAYWPNEDGRHWFYDQSEEDFYPTHEITNSQATLFFDGTTTAPIGIAAQVLKGTVTSSAKSLRILSAGMPATVTDPLLRRVWIARPDLREKIELASVDQPCVSNSIPGWAPLLLTGSPAYVKSVSEIAAWRCDEVNLKAWLWLTSDLTPGHEATLQLVPDLADDVILHVTIGGVQDVTVPAGTFSNALHVDYLIDYGVSQCTSSTGEPLGTSHFQTTGYVRYAPGVGPIECHEEFANEQLTGDCGPSFPSGTLAMSSLKMNVDSVPAHPASWGGVKAAYR